MHRASSTDTLCSTHLSTDGLLSQHGNPGSRSHGYKYRGNDEQAGRRGVRGPPDCSDTRPTQHGDQAAYQNTMFSMVTSIRQTHTHTTATFPPLHTGIDTPRDKCGNARSPAGNCHQGNGQWTAGQATGRHHQQRHLVISKISHRKDRRQIPFPKWSGPGFASRLEKEPYAAEGTDTQTRLSLCYHTRVVFGILMNRKPTASTSMVQDVHMLSESKH